MLTIAKRIDFSQRLGDRAGDMLIGLRARPSQTLQSHKPHRPTEVDDVLTLHGG